METSAQVWGCPTTVMLTPRDRSAGRWALAVLETQDSFLSLKNHPGKVSAFTKNETNPARSGVSNTAVKMSAVASLSWFRVNLGENPQIGSFWEANPNSQMGQRAGDWALTIIPKTNTRGLTPRGHHPKAFCTLPSHISLTSYGMMIKWWLKLTALTPFLRNWSIWIPQGGTWHTTLAVDWLLSVLQAGSLCRFGVCCRDEDFFSISIKNNFQVSNISTKMASCCCFFFFLFSELEQFVLVGERILPWKYWHWGEV